MNSMYLRQKTFNNVTIADKKYSTNLSFDSIIVKEIEKLELKITPQYNPCEISNQEFIVYGYIFSSENQKRCFEYFNSLATYEKPDDYFFNIKLNDKFYLLDCFISNLKFTSSDFESQKPILKAEIKYRYLNLKNKEQLFNFQSNKF